MKNEKLELKAHFNLYFVFLFGIYVFLHTACKYIQLLEENWDHMPRGMNARILASVPGGRGFNGMSHMFFIFQGAFFLGRGYKNNFLCYVIYYYD